MIEVFQRYLLESRALYIKYTKSTRAKSCTRKMISCYIWILETIWEDTKENPILVPNDGTVCFIIYIKDPQSTFHTAQGIKHTFNLRNSLIHISSKKSSASPMENHENSSIPNGWEMVTVVRSDGTTMQITRRSQNCLCAAITPPSHPPYTTYVNHITGELPPYGIFYNGGFYLYGGPQVMYQGHIGASSHMIFPNYPGAPQRRINGLYGGSPHEIITTQTEEILVPRFVVPAIIGDDGRHIRDIVECSGASIAFPRSTPPGPTETSILISGTTRQIDLAKCLIHASVVFETSLLDLHL